MIDPNNIPGPPASAAPSGCLVIYHVTETALTHPGQNAAYLTDARKSARQQIALLEHCLEWLEPGSREHREISEDITWLRNLPGYVEQPDLWEAA